MTLKKPVNVVDVDEAANAIVAHARAYITGEESPVIGDFKLILSAIAKQPNARMSIQRALRDADDDTKEMLKGLVNHAVASLEFDSRDAARQGERIVQPIQTSTIAGTFGVAIAGLAGTIGPLVAFIAAGITISAAIDASYTRSDMARAESRRKRDADLIKALL